MIKNTWSGRTKLFDFDFTDKKISYEKYLELVTEIEKEEINKF